MAEDRPRGLLETAIKFFTDRGLKVDEIKGSGNLFEFQLYDYNKVKNRRFEDEWERKREAWIGTFEFCFKENEWTIGKYGAYIKDANEQLMDTLKSFKRRSWWIYG